MCMYVCVCVCECAFFFFACAARRGGGHFMLPLLLHSKGEVWLWSSMTSRAGERRFVEDESLVHHPTRRWVSSGEI